MVAASVTHIEQVLQRLSTTSVLSVSGMTRDLGEGHAATSLHGIDLSFQNGTGTLSTDASEQGDYKITWLTLRLFLIVCSIICLMVLSWGSYTLHWKYFDDKRKRKYQKALLL